jgi:hypothetical protein
VHDIYVRAQTVDEMAPAARWLSTTLANHTKLTAVMLGLCALVIALIVKRRRTFRRESPARATSPRRHSR